jgi:lysophospholipid acyltransferase (LPLAT)-like uncharacterized protein
VSQYSNQREETSRPRKRRLRKLRNTSGRWLGRQFGAAAIVQMARFCRKSELNGSIRERAESEHKGLILAFWHGRGVLASPYYRPGNTAVLVSASEDGSMATTILKRLGYEIIRGSSSRGGVRALREMLACLERGKHVALTPDGPRGPMHSMSPGAAFMSRATGVPVLPIGLRHYPCPAPGYLGSIHSTPSGIPARDLLRGAHPGSA